MIDLTRVRRASGANEMAPVTVLKVCRCCNIFTLIVAGFCVVLGPVIFMMITFESLGGDTALWTPQIRYYGRIIGGVTFGVGIVLLFLSYQCHHRTENGMVGVLTRYRRQRRRHKPLEALRDIVLEAPPTGAMGDALTLEDIPLDVTVSQVPLMAVTSDHSVISHHMTIESWFNKKFHGESKIVHDNPTTLVHLRNECANNNIVEGSTSSTTEGSTEKRYFTRVENTSLSTPKELNITWLHFFDKPEEHKCRMEEVCETVLEVCTKGQDFKENLIHHQHFSPQKVCEGESAPLEVGEDGPLLETAQVTEVAISGGPAPTVCISPSDDATCNQEVSLSNTEVCNTGLDTTDNLFLQGQKQLDSQCSSEDVSAVLEAIASIDKLTDELAAYECQSEGASLEFDESFDVTTDEEQIRKTLDTVNRMEERILDEAARVPTIVRYYESLDVSSDDVMSSRESLIGESQNDVTRLKEGLRTGRNDVMSSRESLIGESQNDVTRLKDRLRAGRNDDNRISPVTGSTDNIVRISDNTFQGYDPGCFVEPSAEGQDPVQVHPVDTEQAAFSRVRSTQRGAGLEGVSMSEEFISLEVHPHSQGEGVEGGAAPQGQAEGAAGDTGAAARVQGAVYLEEPGQYFSVAQNMMMNDEKKSQDTSGGKEMPDELNSPRSNLMSPNVFISGSHDFLRSSIEVTPAFSTPYSIGISCTPEQQYKDSSASSGFSEAAGTPSGMFLPSDIRQTVHTHSESYFSLPSTISIRPTTPPPVEFTLEPDDNDNTFPSVKPNTLNISGNSNSLENIVFPLQMASANMDLVSATADSVEGGGVLDINENSNNSLGECNISSDVTSSNSGSSRSNMPCRSQSDGHLQMSPLPTASYLPTSGSYSATSALSATSPEGSMYSAVEGSIYSTTDGSMCSAQDTLSYSTVVDSDDDYQRELLLVSGDFGDSILVENSGDENEETTL